MDKLDELTSNYERLIETMSKQMEVIGRQRDEGEFLLKDLAKAAKNVVNYCAPDGEAQRIILELAIAKAESHLSEEQITKEGE